MWNAIHSLCYISLNGWVADALAPRGREGGAGRWEKLKPGHLVVLRQRGMSLKPTERFSGTFPKDDWLLSVDLSHLLHPRYTRPHTSPVTLSSNRVMVTLALFFFLCVTSSLSCSVIFFPPLLIPRRKCVSRRSTSQCQGAKQLISCLTHVRSLSGAWRIPRIPAFAPTTVTPPEGMP